MLTPFTVGAYLSYEINVTGYGGLEKSLSVNLDI